ncbi:hypothetical protein [Thiohalocapsa sp. ML1]|jgi:ADP-ribosyl-[dinitrogen reductase] hydrolase|uniref:phosphatase domain-containing protein n=1 Tax=Thiohalocapsa sp. ML1 TaxID=1431688 RepID=UPI000731F5FE|nr:hypothetical protein [Thiohalocapsa sp. ML1]
MRTSATDPIRIDAVQVATGGRLGLTFCPGKRDPYARGGGWWRDLDADLDAIVAWGACAVLCLLEPHELELLAVPGLADGVITRGMDWHHLPIRDVDVPDDRFEQGWPAVRDSLGTRLCVGEAVVVHCRGGLGRSGLAAARLLIALGTMPRDAIRQVRAVRPGAIETLAQERHVLASAEAAAGNDQGGAG